MSPDEIKTGIIRDQGGHEIETGTERVAVVLCVEQPFSELARKSLSLILRADGITNDAGILHGPSAKVWPLNQRTMLDQKKESIRTLT